MREATDVQAKDTQAGRQADRQMAGRTDGRGDGGQPDGQTDRQSMRVSPLSRTSSSQTDARQGGQTEGW
jgi:hypothetical protein